MSNLSNEKKELLELEKTGLYLFHGSADQIEVIEPHQAYSLHSGEKKPDDEPGVHASPSAEVAIYMAVINQRNCPDGFLTGFESGNNIKGIKYYASAKTLQQLKNNKDAYGFVHIIDRNSASFVQRDEYQYITYGKVKPIKVVKVWIEDMPQNIDILPDLNEAK